MAGEGMIMANPKELRNLHLMRKVLEKEIRQGEAAGILGLSLRQIRRMVKRVRAEGDRGVVHRSRGRPSNRRVPDEIRGKVIDLYRCQYGDFGPRLAAEKLWERDQVRVHEETLRLWLMESGDWKKRRRTRAHRRWRERKHHFGEMVQMDGSHHDWFEGRGPECVLMGYIDDATGKAFGRFYDYEGTIPALDSFKRYVKRYGLPMCLYVDGHTTYKSPAKPSIQDELENRLPLSEFQRALKELGVRVRHARSAQAKGRVERLFRTFQDRVVKEMRLRGVGTVAEGNRFLGQYLPGYNRRFSVVAEEPGDFHRPIPKGMNLDSVLCIQTPRVLRNDFTLAYQGKLYQIEDRTSASKVMVHHQIDGSMKIFDRGKGLRFHEIAQRARRKEKPAVKVRTPKSHSPSPDHPWRDFKFGSHKDEKRKAILNWAKTLRAELDGVSGEDEFPVASTLKRVGSEFAALGEIPVALRAPSISPGPHQTQKP